jgi:hypothetical protein
VLTDALIQWEDDGYSSASIPPDDIFWADTPEQEGNLFFDQRHPRNTPANYIFDLDREHENAIEDIDQRKENLKWTTEHADKDIRRIQKHITRLEKQKHTSTGGPTAAAMKIDELKDELERAKKYLAKLGWDHRNYNIDIDEIRAQRSGLAQVNLSAEDTLEVPSSRFNVEMNAEGGYIVTHNAPDRDGTIEIWEGPAWAWDDIMENLFLDLEMGWMHTPDDLGEAVKSVTMKSRDHTRYMAAETFEAASGAHPELDRDLASLERQVARKYRRYAKGGNVTNAYKLTGRGGSAVVYGPLSSRFGSPGTSSNKFYTVWVYHNKDGSYTALSGWAGLGRPNPQLGELGTYKDRSRAVQAADKKMQSKRKKGYFAYDAEGLDSAGKGFGYTFGGVMGIAGGLTALGVLGWLLRPVLGGGNSE